MWATVAFALNPVKLRLTVIIVSVPSKTTVPEPVPVLPLGGTSCDPSSDPENISGTQDGVGVTLGAAVDVGLGVPGVGVTVGAGVPPLISRNAAVIGPQVSKPWKLFTPRPRTNIIWRPTDRPAVFMVALTATV